jgi:hypothetical protein
MKASIIVFSLLAALVSGLAMPEVVPRQAGTYYPTSAMNLKQDFPDTPFPSQTGIVSRTNGQHDISTLLKFELPALTNKKCTVSFSDPKTLSGSQRMQIFDVGGEMTPQTTYNKRPYRNNYWCGMKVKPVGQGPADIEDDVRCTFDCPKTATTLVLETVPAGESVEITWDIATAGLVIKSS